MKLSDTLIADLRLWLGEGGLKFFGDMRQESGNLLSVHFTSGMQVRNWLRGRPEAKAWGDHDYDELWQEAIYRALDGSTDAWRRVLAPSV